MMTRMIFTELHNAHKLKNGWSGIILYYWRWYILLQISQKPKLVKQYLHLIRIQLASESVLKFHLIHSRLHSLSGGFDQGKTL